MYRIEKVVDTLLRALLQFVQCLHKDFLTPTLCKGRVPATCCVPVMRTSIANYCRNQEAHSPNDCSIAPKEQAVVMVLPFERPWKAGNYLT